MPLATRRKFTTVDHPTCLCYYGDASRKFSPDGHVDAGSLGFGACWTVRDDRLLYIQGRWTSLEASSLHIGVLQLKR